MTEQHVTARPADEDQWKHDTLADILNITFVGNAQDDIINSNKFERINAFLRRKDVSAADKFKADYHANFNGMGVSVEDPGAEYYNKWSEFND